MSLIYGTPVIQSGQGESGFAGIEFVPGGVCYGGTFFGFSEIPICAAGVPTEPLIHYTAPPQLYAVLPTCCTVERPVDTMPIPEPTSMTYILWAIVALVTIRRAVARWV
jgi:hypothetical protein